MLRFVSIALPLLVLLLATFGFAIDVFDIEPRSGAVIKLSFDQQRLPAKFVLGAWMLEAVGLLGLYLMILGRAGTWWLDGLAAGWLAWVFRGPLLVLTIVVAARQPQQAWWDMAIAWWVLYTVCGLALAILARRSGLTGDSSPPPTDSPPPARDEVWQPSVDDPE